MADYTLADLTRITGAPRRSVQLWAEAGAIRAAAGTEHAGTGRHRKFDRAEAVTACILHAFARMKLPIGELLRLSEVLRRRMDATFVEPVAAGCADAFLVLCDPPSGEPFVALVDADADAPATIGKYVTANGEETPSLVVRLGPLLRRLGS